MPCMTSALCDNQDRSYCNRAMRQSNHSAMSVWTWTSSEYAQFYPPNVLSRSIHYFHPDLDHLVFSDRESNEILSKWPWATKFRYPLFSLMALEQYEATIHLDGDSLVVGSLDEMIALTREFDFVGVRNNNALNLAGCDQGITIYHPLRQAKIPVQEYINAGAFGCSSREFLLAWHALNIQCAKSPRVGFADENDTLNLIFHSGQFKVAIVDSLGSGVSYGISNMWGENQWTNLNPWESWKKLYVSGDKIMIDEPGQPQSTRVAILHQACGGLALQQTKEEGFIGWLTKRVSTSAATMISRLIEDVTFSQQDATAVNMLRNKSFRSKWDDPAECLKAQYMRLTNGDDELLRASGLNGQQSRCIIINSRSGLLPLKCSQFFSNVISVESSSECQKFINEVAMHIEAPNVSSHQYILEREPINCKYQIKHESDDYQNDAISKTQADREVMIRSTWDIIFGDPALGPAFEDNLLLVDDPSISPSEIAACLSASARIGTFRYILLNTNNVEESYRTRVDPTYNRKKLIRLLSNYGYIIAAISQSKSILLIHSGIGRRM